MGLEMTRDFLVLAFFDVLDDQSKHLFSTCTRKLNNFINEKTHLLRPLMMKAFPECWVSTFFITL